MVLTTLAAMALAGSPEPPLVAPTRRTLVWSDEFTGTALDPAKWQAPAMNRQGDASRWDPNLVRVGNGFLTLDAQKQSGNGPRYACGAVRTRIDYDRSRTLFEKRFGYFEVRARLLREFRTDLWFAFWIMAGDITDHQTDSRRGSEIDVIETFSAWQNRLGHAVHWGGYGPTHNSFDIPSEPIANLGDGRFHTYGLYWTEDFYAIYRDGRRIAWTNAVGLGSKEGRPKSQGTCREPGYLKLTVEAAPWAGPTPEWEANGPDSDSAVIDYIRVYDVGTGTGK